MELFVKKGRDDMEDRYSLVVNALCMARGVMREGKKTTPDLEKDAARAIDAIGFALTYSGISGGLTVADIEKIAVAWVDRMSANSFIEDRHYLDRYAVPRDKRSLAMILRVALAMKGMDASKFGKEVEKFADEHEDHKQTRSDLMFKVARTQAAKLEKEQESRSWLTLKTASKLGVNDTIEYVEGWGDNSPLETSRS